MQASLSMQRVSMPLTSSFQEKINEEHIYISVFLLFFSFLTVFLVIKDVAVYQDILKVLIIFGGGFGSGIGFKGYRDRKNR
jgi:hypothetical protein